MNSFNFQFIVVKQRKSAADDQIASVCSVVITRDKHKLIVYLAD